MRIRWWPRSIRWQMLAGLLLLESLSIGLFSLLLLWQQRQELRAIAQRRLAYEASSLALQAREALIEEKPGWVGLAVRMMGDSPTVALAKITDPQGHILFVSRGDARQTVLSGSELGQLPQIKTGNSMCLSLQGNLMECAQAIYAGRDLRGFAWVERDNSWAREQLTLLLQDTAFFGAVWIAASALLVLLMARSIARPLAVLHHGAGELMTSLDGASFPLPVSVQNEVGDLIETFNRMVASLAEQRSGLNDTLSLLDSMLANAPIGLAFFDRNCRFVRINQIFADLTGVPLSRHLGRTLPELLSKPVAHDLESAVRHVFMSDEPVRNLELSGEGRNPVGAGKRGGAWTWITSCYPVCTTPHQVRWVGVIVLDASDRKRNEEALRRSEKLAVTGRLAASIAHEINNPLEAITNLLFLLRNHTPLDDTALNYTSMAEYEVRRISEITQQTLRFYRQSTLPARATMAEVLDSVLSLYQGRLSTLNIHVEREYDPDMDLFCFAGEIRQVFANLVGNSIDAAGNGARLVVGARRSRNWKNPSESGLRFTVADTGCGMEPEVCERIFEAFFTTKDVTGTGLGLWVSHEILMKHRGIVHVRSRAVHPDFPDRSAGTVFQIFIPDDPALANEMSPEQS